MASPSHRQGFLAQSGFSANTVRRLMNVWPPFMGAGIRCEAIAADFREARVSLRLRWFNRNYVGTHFGGSLFAMTDPFYMLLMMQNLGPGYVVWDRCARIAYEQPGRDTVQAHFRIGQADIDAAVRATAGGEKYEPIFVANIQNAEGEIVARVERQLYIRKQLTAKIAKPLA